MGMMLRFTFLFYALVLFSLPSYAGPKEVFQKDFLNNVSAIVAAASDYSPRGVTQSDEHFATHGSLYYYDPSGFYLSGGVTSIDYSYDNDAYAEVDLFAGYRWSGLGFNFEVSEASYVYPGTFGGNDYSFFETRFDINKNFGFMDLTAKVKYSPNFWFETGHSFYVPVLAKIPLENGFSLIGEIAHQSVEDNARFGLPDYWHWSGGVSYDYKKFNFSLKYIDTDLSDIECREGCQPRITLTVMRFF